MTKKNCQKLSGWNQLALGEVVVIKDGTHQTPKYVNQGIPFYSVEHVSSGNFENTKFIEESVYKAEKVKMEKGDVLMTRIGDIGTAKFIDWDIRASFYVTLALLKRRIDSISMKFLAYYINASAFQREVWAKTIHVAFPNKINLGDIGKCKVLLPPLPEQKRIVAVLETWDKAIDFLERKIKLKEELKRGLVQGLLTGKKRLPGFSDDWNDVKLGELGKTHAGLSGKNKSHFGKGKPFISYMNVYSNTSISLEELPLVDVGAGEKQFIAKYGDLFFTTSSETPGEVGMSSVLLNKMNGPLYLNSFCFAFRLSSFDTILPEFARYYFRGEEFRKKMTRIAQGASRFNLSKKYFIDTRIHVPLVEEQKAITQVLSNADQEIDLLKTKLQEVRKQKKYLLNNLVTGKIRTPEVLKTSKR